MSGSSAEPKTDDAAATCAPGPWYRRPGLWINLAVLLGLWFAVGGIQRWRQAQFDGYGLAAVYYQEQNYAGTVFRRSQDPFIDFSDRSHPALFKRASFSVQWSGTIVLPRRGRYTFATESDDGSTLELDGRMLVNNGGTHGLQRREAAAILDGGPHAIRIRYFQAGMGAEMRVFWSPAGRRGGLEVIPPTVLFDSPPERVDLRRAHPVPPRDFAAAMLMVLAALLALTVWTRRPLLAALRRLARDRQLQLDLALFSALFLLALAVRVWDLHAHGRTWDEDVYWAAGRNFWQNLLSGAGRAEDWAWNNEHPALAKWLYGWATLWSDSFAPPRVVSAVLGALTCALVFAAGRDLVSRRVGVLGGALAAVMPHIVAHHKIIGLETPTGLFYALCAWLFFRAVRIHRRTGRVDNSGYHLAAALCAGALVATRVSNISILIVIFALYLVAAWPTIRRDRTLPVPLTLGIGSLLAVALFFVIWPYLWDNPMKHIGEMLTHWEPDIYLEWYLGKKQKPTSIYFPLYFFVTMPVGAFAALSLGLVALLIRRTLGVFALFAWLLAPFLVMFSPLARDGVRYLYPALFAACLLMAAGLDGVGRLVAHLVRRPGLATPVVSFTGVALVLYVFYCGTTVHPYQLDYYNEMVGGPKKVQAQHRFEIAWWGEGLKEAGDFVSQTAPTNATVKVYVHPTHVVNLRPDIGWVDDAKTADYVMFNELFNTLPSGMNHKPVYVVRVAGAPMVWVYQRNDLQKTK